MSVVSYPKWQAPIVSRKVAGKVYWLAQYANGARMLTPAFDSTPETRRDILEQLGGCQLANRERMRSRTY